MEPLSDTVMTVAREIRRVASLGYRSWVPDDLGGLCAITARALSEVLIKRLKLEPTLVFGTVMYKGEGGYDCNSGHAWTEIGGWVLDVTATQFYPFKMVPILVEPALEMSGRGYILEGMYSPVDNEGILKETREWCPEARPTKRNCAALVRAGMKVKL